MKVQYNLKQNLQTYLSSPSNLTERQVTAFLNLFKIIPEEPIQGYPNYPIDESIGQGVVFVNAAGEIYPSVPQYIGIAAKNKYGKQLSAALNTFYKTFNEVEKRTRYELMLDQIRHYVSTYGTNFAAQPWIPVSAVIPQSNISGSAQFTVIRILSLSECIARLGDFVKQIRSVNDYVLDELKELLDFIPCPTTEIASFSLQAVLYRHRNEIPEHPETFLKYLVYSLIGVPYLIKSKEQLAALQAASQFSDFLVKALSQANLESLGSVFFRHKPTFLAFRANKECRPIINKIRRLADIYHKPLSSNSIQTFYQTSLENKHNLVAKATNRELVKLFNFSIAHQIQAPRVYNIRNGKIYVNTTEKVMTPQSEYYPFLHELILRLAPVLKGQKFYIPEGIEYTVPTSEKQFTGSLPWGTQFILPKNDSYTVGVTWNGRGVDLDLHMNSLDGNSYGWNSGYNNENTTYSGDMTDGRDGAAEAFWVKNTNQAYTAGVYLFNGDPGQEFYFYLSKGSTIDESRIPYDPNNVLFPPIKMKFADSEQQELALFVQNKAYLYGGTVENARVPRQNKQDFILGLFNRLDSQLLIPDLLLACGAIIYETLPNTEDPDIIDLSPEALTPDTLFNIIDGKIENLC